MKVTKDPKKQAAGRAGAAARKANQDRILKELQAAKKDLRKHEEAKEANPHSHKNFKNLEIFHEDKPTTHPTHTTHTTYTSKIKDYIVPTLIVGSASIAYYIYIKNQLDPSRSGLSPSQSGLSPSQPKTKSDLNNRNPNYME